ncbi:hypothetical protein HDV00_009918 [Rhizophlyctis rosea]|nr:hypothetical protein HDV00_009918 [Rhizophlyctis rosea]
MAVNGRLNILGTSTNPVLLSSPNGASSSAIQVYNDGTVTAQNTYLSDLYMGIRKAYGNSTITLTGVTFDGLQTAIQSDSAGIFPISIANCSFLNNNRAFEGWSIPPLRINSSIFKNNWNVFDNLQLSNISYSIFENNSWVVGGGYQNTYQDNVFSANGNITAAWDETFTRNLFADNAGIFTNQNPTYNYFMPTFVNNSVCGTTGWVFLYNRYPAVAVKNYWGTTNYTLVRELFYDANYDSTLPEVQVTPLLSAPVATFGTDMYKCTPPVEKLDFPYNGGNGFTEDTTFTAASSPYFEGSGTLTVRGNLNVTGTPDRPVQFQGPSNGTALNLMSSSSAPWSGYQVSSTRSISNAQFTNSYIGVQQLPSEFFYWSTDSLNIVNSSFNGGYAGVYLNGSSSAQITFTNFTNLQSGLVVGNSMNGGVSLLGDTFQTCTTGVDAARYMYMTNTTFLNNTVGAKVTSGSIYGSDFTLNKIAVQLVQASDSYGYISQSTIVGNDVGVESSISSSSISGGNVCGNRLNLDVKAGRLSGSAWFGVADRALALPLIADSRTVLGTSAGNTGIFYGDSEASSPYLDRTKLIHPCLTPISMCRSECSGNGARDVNGTCRCARGWTGDQCGTCQYTGPDCTPSPGDVKSDCNACIAEGFAWCNDTKQCVNVSSATCSSYQTTYDACTSGANIPQKAYMDGQTIKIVFQSDWLKNVTGGKSGPFSCSNILSSTSLNQIQQASSYSGAANCTVNVAARSIAIVPTNSYRTLWFSPWFEQLHFGGPWADVANLSALTPNVTVQPPSRAVSRPNLTVSVLAPVAGVTRVSTCAGVTLAITSEIGFENVISGDVGINFNCTYGKSNLSCVENNYLRGSDETDTAGRSDYIVPMYVPASMMKGILNASGGTETPLSVGLMISDRWGRCWPNMASLTVLPPTTLTISILGPSNLVLGGRGYTTINTLVTLPNCALNSAPLQYTWSWDAGFSATGIIPANSTLQIHPSAVTASGGWVNVTVVDPARRNKASSSVWVTRGISPLTAALKQNGASYALNSTINITVVGYDPSGLTDTGTFGSATCQFQPDSSTPYGSCNATINDVLSKWSAAGTSVNVYESKAELSFPPPQGGFRPGLYNFNITFTKGSRSVTAWGYAVAFDGTILGNNPMNTLPEARIDLITPQFGSYSPPTPSNRTTIFAAQRLVFQAYPLGPQYNYTWSIHGDSGFRIPDSKGPTLEFSEAMVQMLAGHSVNVALYISTGTAENYAIGLGIYDFFISASLDAGLILTKNSTISSQLISIAAVGRFSSSAEFYCESIAIPGFGWYNAAQSLNTNANTAVSLLPAPSKSLYMQAFMQSGWQAVRCEVTDVVDGLPLRGTYVVFGTINSDNSALQNLTSLLATYSNTAQMGSLLSTAGASLSTAFDTTPTYNVVNVTPDMIKIANLAQNAGLSTLDCTSAVKLGLNASFIGSTFLNSTTWCSDAQVVSSTGQTYSQTIYFADYYGLIANPYDFRNATVRTSLAELVLGYATPWVQSQLGGINTQRGVKHVLGVVRDVVHLLNYGGDATTHVPKLATAVQSLATRSALLASPSLKSSGTVLFQAQQPINSTIIDMFSYTIGRFAGLNVRLPGVDDALAGAMTSLMGTLKDISVGQKPLVVESANTFFAVARDFRVPTIDLGDSGAAAATIVLSSAKGVLMQTSVSSACGGGFGESWMMCSWDISSTLGQKITSIGFRSDNYIYWYVAGVQLVGANTPAAAVPAPFGQAIQFSSDFLTQQAVKQTRNGIIETRVQMYSSSFLPASNVRLDSAIINLALYNTSGTPIAIDMGTQKITVNTWLNHSVAPDAACITTDFITWKNASCDGPTLIQTVSLGANGALYQYQCICSSMGAVAIGKVVVTTSTTSSTTTSSTTSIMPTSFATTTTPATTTTSQSTSTTTTATTTTKSPLPYINPCPNPPTTGTLQLSGLSLVNASSNVFQQTGTGQVRFAAVITNCTFARVTTSWSIDGKVDSSVDSSLLYNLQLQSFTTDVEHKVNATVTYYDLDGKLLATLTATRGFKVQGLPLAAKLLTVEKTVPVTLDLTIDGSASYDQADPCYVTSFAGALALRKCLTANSLLNYNTSGTQMTFLFRCTNTTTGGPCAFTGLKGLGATSQDTDLYFNTTSPYLTIPVASLVPGNTSFTVSVARDSRSAGPSDPVNIKIADTRTYVLIQSVNVAGASVDTTFVGNAKVSLQAKVSTNAQSPVYTWSLAGPTGATVSLADTTKFTQSNTSLTISSGALADGTYTATLNIKDDSNSANATATFTILSALPPPTGPCSISPTSGTELSTSFTATCSGPLSLGRYRYSYDNGQGTETVLATGASTQSFPLAAALSTNNYVGTVLVRATIPGTSLVSSPVNISVTVNPMAVNADNIGATFSNILALGAGDNGATAAAAAQSLTSKLSTLSDTDKQQVAGQFMAAMTGTINSTQETTESATNKAAAMASILGTSNVTDATKSVAADGMKELAKTLANGASGAEISTALDATLATVATNATSDGGDKTTATVQLLAQGLGANLAAGESTSVKVGGTSLDVASSNPSTIPSTVGRGRASTGLQRRTTTATCEVQPGDGLKAALSSYSSDATVLLQSACMAKNVYPIADVNSQTNTSTLSPYLVNFGVTVNGQTFNGALSSPITITIPTDYTSKHTFSRRWFQKRSTDNTTTTTYASECVMWDSSAGAWSSDGCTTTNNSTDTQSVTCQCNKVGSYSVLIVATTQNTTTNTGSGAVSVRMSVLTFVLTLLSTVTVLSGVL